MLCCCTNNLNQYPLRKQFQLIFGKASLFALIAVGITTIVWLVVVSNNVEHQIVDSITDVLLKHAKLIVQDGVELYNKQLDKSGKNVLNPIAYLMEESFRDDQPYDKQPFFYEWMQFMKQPLVFVPEYNSYIAYGGGDVNVAGYTPYTMYNFTAEINNTIYATQAADRTMMHLYFANKEFQTGYCAFNAYGIFREYPGACNGNYTQLISYDAREDEWYQLGYQQQHKTLYTSLYVDEWLKQIMITIVRSIHHPETGEYVGTAGGDMLTQSIRESILDIKYLPNGRCVLFEQSTGYIIADSNWDPHAQVTHLVTYTTLNNPIITIAPDKWYLITNGLSTKYVNIVELDEYYVASQSIAVGNGQYFLSIFVAKTDIDHNISSITDNISSIKKQTYGVVASVFVVILVLFFLFVLWFAYATSKPITDANEDLDKYNSNVGNSNSVEGIELVQAPGGIAEPNESRHIRAELRNLIIEFGRQNEARKNNSNNNNIQLIHNVHYNEKAQSSRSIVKFHSFETQSVQSAPPPYEPPY